MFEVETFPDCSRDELLALVAARYFSPEELSEARRQLAEGTPYAEVLRILAERGQDEFRQVDCCLTIPGGKVLAHPPDRSPGDLSYIAFPLMEVVQAAFAPVGEASALNAQDPSTLWGQLQSTPAAPGERVRKNAQKTAARGRVSFEQVPFGRGEGWVAKARGAELGLGYQVRPLSDGRGFAIELIHRKSGLSIASAWMYAPHLDHERIREWVVACLPVAEWSQAYQTVLRQQPEQQGMLKRHVLAQRLEAIWAEMASKLRQGTLFDHV